MAFTPPTIETSQLIYSQYPNLIFIFGQSGAQGNALNSNALSIEIDVDSGTYIFNYTDTSFAPLDIGTNNLGGSASKHGAELWLSNNIREVYPEQLYICKYGVGGQRIVNFVYGGAYDNIMMERHYVTAVNELIGLYGGVNVLGIFWDQGEGDAGTSTAAANAYEGYLDQLVDTFRSVIPNIPIVAKALINNGASYQIVNGWFAQKDTIDPYFGYVEDAGSFGALDAYHLNYVGMKEWSEKALKELKAINYRGVTLTDSIYYDVP